MIDCKKLMEMKRELLITIGANPNVAWYYTSHCPSERIRVELAKTLLEKIENYTDYFYNFSAICCDACCPYCAVVNLNYQSIRDCKLCSYGKVHGICGIKENNTWSRVMSVIKSQPINLILQEDADLILSEMEEYINNEA